MAIFPIDDPASYSMAGPTDLLALASPGGPHPIYITKEIVDTLVYSVCSGKLVHLSGPSGSAKTSLLEALAADPANFDIPCRALGFEPKPLKLYPIEMCRFETPGEVLARRALRQGETYDEPSELVKALISAAEEGAESYPVMWLREMGRVHSSAVQGGLLDLMTKSDIVLPDGARIQASRIAWVSDSNYAASDEDLYTLVPLDAALNRRFSVNIRLDYLLPEQEVEVLQQIATGSLGLGEFEDARIQKVVKLGQKIRALREEGELRSLAPPTIYAYLTFLEMSNRLTGLSLYDVAKTTLLGNASREDGKQIPGLFSDVFGLSAEDGEDDDDLGDTLF